VRRSTGSRRSAGAIQRARAQKAKGEDWKEPAWDVVYRENPTKEQMPKGLEKVGTHMFGPDVLLAGWPERKGK
jgi:hypothetical protein